ncbi:hypothetical protein N8198_06760 [Gammaproteobacteria bacterium]|nr:hypothetical protein [Gammaproteobacteria bacterium]
MLNTRFNSSLALIFLGLFLTGCASGTYSTTSKRPAVKPGSYVQIHHEYQIPDEFARVYFRNGKQTLKGDVDRFTPYCYILMHDIRQAGQPQQTIFPGRFQVTKVIESNDYQGGGRTYVASLGLWGFDDGVSNVNYQLEMRLSSDEQPGVRALRCVNNADDYMDRRYPNLSEIKIALGDLVTIEAPGQ